MANEPGCWQADVGWHGAPLDTARLRLRRLERADASAITALLADGVVARTTSNIPHPFDQSCALGFIADMERAAAAGQGYALAIERTTDRALVGCIGFEVQGLTAEIGYWVGRDCWGRGYATEAVRRLLRLLFKNFRLSAVRAAALTHNPASCRVLEKAGLSYQCTEIIDMPARGAKGEFRQFALSREEWLIRDAGKRHLLVAAAALIDVDGRVLLATRPPGKQMSGLWEFPGGKVDPGETPEAALVRELKEELDIDTGESCLAPLAFASHDYDTFHLLMPLYVCRSWKGTVRAVEGQSLAWVWPNKLADYPMPPADIPLVAILRDWL